jgi:hypothetical protein
MEKPVDYTEWLGCVQTAVLAARLQMTVSVRILVDAMEVNVKNLKRETLYEQTLEYVSWHMSEALPANKPEWLK